MFNIVRGKWFLRILLWEFYFDQGEFFLFFIRVLIKQFFILIRLELLQKHVFNDPLISHNL